MPKDLIKRATTSPVARRKVLKGLLGLGGAAAAGSKGILKAIDPDGNIKAMISPQVTKVAKPPTLRTGSEIPDIPSYFFRNFLDQQSLGRSGRLYSQYYSDSEGYIPKDVMSDNLYQPRNDIFHEDFDNYDLDHDLPLFSELRDDLERKGIQPLANQPELVQAIQRVFTPEEIELAKLYRRAEANAWNAIRDIELEPDWKYKDEERAELLAVARDDYKFFQGRLEDLFLYKFDKARVLDDLAMMKESLEYDKATSRYSRQRAPGFYDDLPDVAPWADPKSRNLSDRFIRQGELEPELPSWKDAEDRYRAAARFLHVSPEKAEELRQKQKAWDAWARKKENEYYLEKDQSRKILWEDMPF